MSRTPGLTIGGWQPGTGCSGITHGLEAPPRLVDEREGLPHASNIFRIFEDSRGAIWVSIREVSDNRLYRRDPGTGRFEQFREADGLPPLHLEQNVPSALVEDRNGAVWIGMLNGGLVRYRNGRFQFASAAGAPRQGVRALLVDGQGRLWIGSDGEGLLRVDDPSAATSDILRLYQGQRSFE